MKTSACCCAKTGSPRPRGRATQKQLRLNSLRPSGSYAMIKSFGFLQRRPGMTHEQFVRHWHDVHVPMSHDVPGLRGYIVSTVVDQQTRADVPGFDMAPFDGIAQTW